MGVRNAGAGDANDGVVNEEMGDWIRRFVEMAINDEELSDDEESDEEVIVLPVPRNNQPP